MPPKTFNTIFRSRPYGHSTTVTWRPAYQNVRQQSTRPSRLSQSLATGFWRACIALSLLPPAYFIYLLKQRFWPSQSSAILSSIFSEDHSKSAAGQQAILVRIMKGKQSGSAAAVDLAGADSRERYVKAKAALELLDDAGLLQELEQRWVEREVERLQQRLARVEQKKQGHEHDKEH